jgi:hypothetical protein
MNKQGSADKKKSKISVKRGKRALQIQKQKGGVVIVVCLNVIACSRMLIVLVAAVVLGEQAPCP